MSNRFAKDSAEILLKKFQAGQVDRRGFLTALAALGLGVTLRPSTGNAAENEIVLCNWGGVAVDAFQKAFGGPFTAKTGMKLVIDGAGPAIGSVRTMVDRPATMSSRSTTASSTRTRFPILRRNSASATMRLPTSCSTIRKPPGPRS